MTDVTCPVFSHSLVVLAVKRPGTNAVLKQENISENSSDTSSVECENGDDRLCDSALSQY